PRERERRDPRAAVGRLVAVDTRCVAAGSLWLAGTVWGTIKAPSSTGSRHNEAPPPWAVLPHNASVWFSRQTFVRRGIELRGPPLAGLISLSGVDRQLPVV